MKLTPMRKLAIGNLVDADPLQVGCIWDRVFQMRRFMEGWRRVHEVEISVTRLMDEHRDVIAGPEEAFISPQVSPVV